MSVPLAAVEDSEIFTDAPWSDGGTIYEQEVLTINIVMYKGSKCSSLFSGDKNYSSTLLSESVHCPLVEC